MLRSRITPVLLIHNKGLVKTQKFKDSKYVGDPLNAVRIFNEKEVDELMVIDIDCTRYDKEPDFSLIEKLASECRMPLCYGGGIRTADQALRLVNSGVEKVAVSNRLVENIDFAQELSDVVGQQSVVGVLDIKKIGWNKKFKLFTHNGTKQQSHDPFEFAQELEKIGVGEIIINSIDNDGMMNGYDMKLVHKMRNLLNMPITFVGGAGSLDDIKKIIDAVGPIGAAAGSLFVFKGKYRAVLINYPDPDQKKSLYKLKY